MGFPGVDANGKRDPTTIPEVPLASVPALTFAKLPFTKLPNFPASTAADHAALLIDFNILLLQLKASGLMAADP